MRQDILGKLEALPSMSEGDAYLLAKDFEVYKNDLRFWILWNYGIATC